MTDRNTTRRLALTRKVSLADLAEGWDECYAIVTLGTFADMTELADKGNPADLKPVDVARYEIEVVRRHFVSGKVMVLNDDDEAVLADMNIDDVDGSSKLADMLYAGIMGVDLDPKGSSREAPTTSAPSTDSKSTQMSSMA